MSEPDFAAMLVEVRKAYRIVAAYQQRVFFLLDEIRAAFPELAMTYWEPSFFARPPQGPSVPMEKWSWDGLPFYSTMNWLTLDGTNTRSALKKGDWFIVAQITADDSFDPDTNPRSGSFSGPDPVLMPPVEDADSEFRLYLYHVHSDRTGPHMPGEVWRADDDLDAEDEVWDEISTASANRIFWIRSLADVFAENGTAQLAELVRAELSGKGITPR